MIIENLLDVTILDGNGDPFDERKRYFNRYQSKIPHTLTLNGLFIKHIKTVGGYISDRPAVHIHVTYPNYAGGKTRRHDSHFEAEYIKEGMYGFHQLIPVDKGIKLDFEYGDNRSYMGAVLKKLAEDSAMEGNQQKMRKGVTNG